METPVVKALLQYWLDRSSTLGRAWAQELHVHPGVWFCVQEGTCQWPSDTAWTLESSGPGLLGMAYMTLVTKSNLPVIEQDWLISSLAKLAGSLRFQRACSHDPQKRKGPMNSRSRLASEWTHLPTCSSGLRLGLALSRTFDGIGTEELPGIGSLPFALPFLALVLVFALPLRRAQP